MFFIFNFAPIPIKTEKIGGEIKKTVDCPKKGKMEREINRPYKVLLKMADKRLEILSKEIESTFNADVLYFNSGIDMAAMEVFNEVIYEAHEKSELKNGRIVIILNSKGGTADCAIEMIKSIRKLYNHVVFIVTRKAMSAGTLICLSGNEILMNDMSALGAIDLQLIRNDKQHSLNVLKNRIKKSKEILKSDPTNGLENRILHNIETRYEFMEQIQFQENIKDLVLKYFKEFLFKDFETLDKKEQDRILDIPNRLIESDFLSEMDLFYHDSFLSIQDVNTIGLPVKDYRVEYPKMSKNIEELDDLVKEFLSLKFGMDRFFIYNRLVKDVPIITQETQKETYPMVTRECVTRYGIIPH